MNRWQLFLGLYKPRQRTGQERTRQVNRLIWFRNVPNKEVENVSENIQYDKMNVMFIADTMHDSESISLSKLWSRGQKSGSDFQLNISRMLSNLTSTVFLKHLCVRMNSNFKSVIGCLSHWKCVFIVESQKLRNEPIEGKALACYKSCYETLFNARTKHFNGNF